MNEGEHWTGTEEILRGEIANVCKQKESMQRTYQWVVTSIVVILGIFIGMVIQSERYSKTVFVTEFRVSNLEKQYEKIDGKLNLLIENQQGETR